MVLKRKDKEALVHQRTPHLESLVFDAKDDPHEPPCNFRKGKDGRAAGVAPGGLQRRHPQAAHGKVGHNGDIVQRRGPKEEAVARGRRGVQGRPVFSCHVPRRRTTYMGRRRLPPRRKAQSMPMSHRKVYIVRKMSTTIITLCHFSKVAWPAERETQVRDWLGGVPWRAALVGTLAVASCCLVVPPPKQPFPPFPTCSRVSLPQSEPASTPDSRIRVQPCTPSDDARRPSRGCSASQTESRPRQTSRGWRSGICRRWRGAASLASRAARHAPLRCARRR